MIPRLGCSRRHAPFSSLSRFRKKLAEATFLFPGGALLVSVFIASSASSAFGEMQKPDSVADLTTCDPAAFANAVAQGGVVTFGLDSAIFTSGRQLVWAAREDQPSAAVSTLRLIFGSRPAQAFLLPTPRSAGPGQLAALAAPAGQAGSGQRCRRERRGWWRWYHARCRCHRWRRGSGCQGGAGGSGGGSGNGGNVPAAVGIRSCPSHAYRRVTLAMR